MNLSPIHYKSRTYLVLYYSREWCNDNHHGVFCAQKSVEHHCRGGVEGPAGTANAVPLFTVVRIAVPLFKAGRTDAANVPPRMRDCRARAYSIYAWVSTVELKLTKAIV